MHFAEVFNTSYDRAHKHLKEHCFRLNGRGVLPKHFHKQLPQSIKRHKYVIGEYSRKNRITLSQFCKKHPLGRFYCCVRGHAIAIIDGIVYDHCHKPRRQITWAMRVYLKED